MRLSGVFNGIKKPLIVVAIGILLYELLENFTIAAGTALSLIGILKPVLYGIAIAFIANIPMRLLETKLLKRWRISWLKRTLCLALAVMLVIAAIASVFLLIIPRLAENMGSLTESLSASFNDITLWANDAWTNLNLAPEAAQWLQQFAQTVPERLGASAAGAMAGALKLTMGIVSFAVNLVLAFIISFYLLYNKEKFLFQVKKLVVALFKSDRAENLLDLGARTNKALNNYFGGLILECTILGAICFITLTLFGFKYAPLISVFVALMQIVPVVGPWISGIISVLIMAMVEPESALWFALILMAVQLVESNIIYPRVVGRAVGLSGIWVMIAVLLGWGLFGITGVILCVPVMAVLYTLLAEWVNRKLKARQMEVEATS